MNKTLLVTSIILGVIGYVLADCRTAPCVYDGTCIARGNAHKCSCQTGFEGDKCEKPNLKDGLCPDANGEAMLRALVADYTACTADCTFDFQCPVAEKCCLQTPCNMRCMAATDKDLTPCEQERKLMDRTRATFQDFSNIDDITFREYVTAVQNNSGFNRMLGRALSSASLEKAVQMFGEEPLGNIYDSVMAVVPFPSPACTAEGAYVMEQCSEFLNGARGPCKNLTDIIGRCGKKPIPGDGTKYRDITSGNNVSCPNTYIYDEDICECVQTIGPYGDPECKEPEVDLPFLSGIGIADRNGRTWIGKSGVKLVNRTGATGGTCAYFNGRASLRIPLFKGSGWGTRVYIKLRYQEDAAGGRPDPEALFSNAACKAGAGLLTEPSVVIAHDPASSVVGHVISGAKTTFTVPTTQGVWKTVTLSFDSSLPALQLTVDGTPTGVPVVVTPHVTSTGKIKTMSCPVGIGASNTFANFKGCIDYVQIYRCIPN